MLLKCCAPAQGVDVEKGVEVYVEGAGSKAGAEVTGVLLFDMKDVRWMVRLPDGATLALPQFLQRQLNRIEHHFLLKSQPLLKGFDNCDLYNNKYK